jgi:hypothetical protein
MGRFDALNNLEEQQEKKTPPQVVPSPTPKTVPTQPQNKQITETKKQEAKKAEKPTSIQTHKTTNKSNSIELAEKPEKYTTHLEPSMVKKIKRYALDEEMKDYQVIQEALLLYFDKKNR